MRTPGTDRYRPCTGKRADTVQDMTIVGTDGSAPAAAAADWAADRTTRAAGSPAAMALVRVVEPVRHEDDGTIDRRLAVARASVRLEAERLIATRPDLDVAEDVVYGDPGEVLRELSSVLNVVVLGSPPRQGRGASLIDRIVATSNGPVAVVPVRASPSGVESTTGIVVGVDGTDASLAALAFAADEAARWGEPLEAVHAWLDLPVPVGLGPSASTVVARSGSGRPKGEDAQTSLLRSQHGDLLHEAVASIVSSHPTLVVHETLVQGSTTRVLLDAARFHRLLVVGNHGRRQIARYLLGSVSHATVLAVAGPTVVVRVPVEE